MIRPADIERVRFTTTRLKEGYDQEEVDAFLERVSDALTAREEQAERAEAEAVRLRSRLAEVQRQSSGALTQPIPAMPSEPPTPIGSAARLLELAQQTADELTDKAKRDAALAEAEARDKARSILDEATTEADKRRRVAEADVYRAQQELAATRELRDNTRSHLISQLSNLKAQLEDE